MTHPYALEQPFGVASPALLFYLERIRANLRRMLDAVGEPNRLRPHVKTHKTREITRLYLQAGITRHKCATLAEAALLAECGAADVLIAYPLVGPHLGRLARLASQFPDTRFSTLVDYGEVLRRLAAVSSGAGQSIGIFVDVNVGQDRTGVPPAQAASLARKCVGLRGVQFQGLHLYDGQNRAGPPASRLASAQATAQLAWEMADQLHHLGLPQPRIVTGGTPGFLAHAQVWAASGLAAELSPGTCILHDAGYERDFPELGFVPAAALLTRVVSRPLPRRITFDVGTKAVAADLPAGQRLLLVGLESAVAMLHHEEHFTVETDQADPWRPGDVAYAIPSHVCPTVALHRFAHVVEGGSIVDRWEIAARDRELPTLM